MAALLTDQFRIFSAKKFIKSLEGPDANQSDTDAGANRDRLYIFIGRPQSWDNENSPPQAVDSFSQFSASYDDMVSLKRVLASDTIQVVRRIDCRTVRAPWLDGAGHHGCHCRTEGWLQIRLSAAIRYASRDGGRYLLC